MSPCACSLCIDQAKGAVKEAQRCDPDSVFTHFCVYKMAALERDAEKGTGEGRRRRRRRLHRMRFPSTRSSHFPPATEALNAMGPLLCKDPPSSDSRLLVPDTAASSLLSLAAQIALEVRWPLPRRPGGLSGPGSLKVIVLQTSRQVEINN